MPRKRYRYAALDKKLRDSEGNIPAGSKLDNFLKFRTGVNKITINNKPNEGDRKRYGMALHPFAIAGNDATANGRYKVGITSYSYTAINSIGLNDSDVGIFFIQGGEEEDVNFYPALIKPSLKAGSYTANANKRSAVTGEVYNYVPTRTFSIPFGRTTQAADALDGTPTNNIAASEELDVLRHLKTQIESGPQSASLKSIGYEPEVFKDVSRAKDALNATDIPAATIPFST